MLNDFYVYALLRADLKTPFYIGKGRGNRINCHTIPRELKKRGMKNSIIKKVIAEVGHLPRHKVYEGLTEAEAFTIECDLITMLGRRNVDGGYTANLTDGGEGTSGMPRTARQLEVLAANNANRWSRAGEGEVLSNRNREMWSDPSFKESTGKAISAAIMANPEERAKRASRNSARWDDPDFRERVSKNISAGQADPAVKAIQSAKRIARMADPEFKARHAASVRAGMARKAAEKAAACS